MEIIWHGTASIELRNEGKRILFDPFVPVKGSPVDVNIAEYDGFDHIFITHGHFDHIYSLPEIVSRNREVLIHCTAAPYNTLIKKGISEKNLELISYGDVICVNGFKISAYHGKHAELPSVSLERLIYALRSPNRKNLKLEFLENRRCPENGETLLYHVECGAVSVSIMGSLNMRAGVDYPEGADLLVLPYNGWDDNFPPAVNVIERLKPKKVLLDHYDDTFPPLTRPLELAPIIDRYPELVSKMELRVKYEI